MKKYLNSNLVRFCWGGIISFIPISFYLNGYSDNVFLVFMSAILFSIVLISIIEQWKF